MRKKYAALELCNSDDDEGRDGVDFDAFFGGGDGWSVAERLAYIIICVIMYYNMNQPLAAVTSSLFPTNEPNDRQRSDDDNSCRGSGQKEGRRRLRRPHDFLDIVVARLAPPPFSCLRLTLPDCVFQRRHCWMCFCVLSANGSEYSAPTT